MKALLDLRLRMITPLMNLGFRMVSPLLVDLEFTLTMSTVLMLVLSHPSLGLVVRSMMILQAFLRRSSLLLRCPSLSML